MKRNLLTALTLLSLTVIPSSVLAQGVTPPANTPSIESSDAAAAALVFLAVKEVLTLVLPYINKSKPNQSTEERNRKTEEICNGVAEILRSCEDTQELVRDLHDWHNVQDPETGRMVWYGLGLTRLEKTLGEISRNIQTSTEVLQHVLDVANENRREIQYLKRNQENQ